MRIIQPAKCQQCPTEPDPGMGVTRPTDHSAMAQTYLCFLEKKFRSYIQNTEGTTEHSKVLLLLLQSTREPWEEPPISRGFVVDGGEETMEPETLRCKSRPNCNTYVLLIDGLRCLHDFIQALPNDGDHLPIDLRVRLHRLPDPYYPPLLHLLYFLQH